MKFVRIPSGIYATLSHPAIPPVLCAVWMLRMGGGKTWNNQMGQWPAGLAPWTGSVALDFVIVAVVASILMAFLKNISDKRRTALLILMMLAGQFAALIAAGNIISGTFPQGIDHPAFMFRVREFAEIFPFALGSYNPWWNAGIEHFIGVTSGAQNFGIINLPLLKLFEIESFYGGAVFFWMIIGFPWIGVLSLHASGARHIGAVAGGMMLCAATRSMYLFFWQSGNIGGMVSTMLSLPVAALGWRVVVLRRGGMLTALSLGILAWLVCIWSPGIFVCVGVALGWLLNHRHWTRRQIVVLFSGGALALLLYSPWLWVVLFPCRGIVEHVGGSGAVAETQLQMIRTAFSQLSRRVQEWHPLIIFFGLYTGFFRFRGVSRRYLMGLFAPAVLVTLSIGWKRDSQLDRISLSLATMCIMPAAIEVERLFSSRRCRGRGHFAVLAQGIVIAALFMGLRIAVAHCGNSAGFKMWPSQPSVDEFIEVVRREVPHDARLAFAGDTDCRYEWGKPAFFPILADREMMADDYYGYPRKLIPYKYPPLPYRSTVEGVVEFSRIYGITHWASAEPYWRGVFTRNTNEFSRVHSMRMQSSEVDVFKVVSVENPGRFFEGDGRVEAKENRIDVFPSNPSTKRVVIRYNWRDGLICRTAGAEIKPYKVDDQTVFIAIEPNGNSVVTIGYRPLWRPLAPNTDGTYHH